MSPTWWFIVHILINGLFFVFFKHTGNLIEYLSPDLIKDESWLQAKYLIPEVAYGIFWVGMQVYQLAFKRYERFTLYFMFAVLAVIISRVAG